ncbi:hypothetical protein PGIGA_G00146450 [Pangasianodon gigas]|uniref:Uncharacterized protein n=1 Tax=Pangasianodon gigas TaxID=30993 RepID=A0ACC5XMP5_PANGG|nr:hypothetical protein [Pangasianodon gigas]
MTNKLDLRLFLFLLIVSSLVSGRHLLGVEENNPQNTTVFNYTQHNNETELQPTSGPPQTTDIREERSTAAPTPGQNTSELSQGNGTSGNIKGTETNSTKHQSPGNESLASTEGPPQTQFPEKNGSSDPTMPTSAPTFSASMGHTKEANATNSVPTVVTTPHMGTDGPSNSTTVKPMVRSTTKISTTQNHTPTKPHSTQKPDESTTKVCPTAEAKGDSLVGRCLIVIASLAALATIFIMTTIVLATKLAGIRHRHRASLLHETEMICISALMNDSDHPIPKPKHPKSNGALIPITEDEDGDDLTLNSFLHDTEGVA